MDTASDTRLNSDAETRELRVVGPGFGLGDKRRSGHRIDIKEKFRDDAEINSGTGVVLRLVLRSRTQSVEIRL